ncbi:NYN domain-containing protein [Actinomadura sp. 7K534]|uniref:NYN domain-containing protein n=1 Tax=Actinomadura sp. 7K534 TaxID=2530366 RepID=UPI001042C6D9|nr:NYN domain-containing protein [Actinomadura sp. 7K534]TDB96936.1 NYN domain-containing protein [Actinomadura sp. 7K534]
MTLNAHTAKRKPTSPLPINDTTTNNPMSKLIRDPEHHTGQLRLGVFYDGGWFSGLWRYLAGNSHWRSAPTFIGVHDVIRWFLHLQGHPLDAVTLDCAHYVLGRPEPGKGGAGEHWDRVLDRYGIVRHDALVVDGREKNADALLKQVTYQHATDRALDAVALITGDNDLLPLVHRLTRDGLTVVVPSLPEIRYTDHTGRRWIRTSPKLTEAATYAPDWRDLLSTAIEPDYPLSYPFTDPVPGALSKPAADGYRYGTVNRWHPYENYAFIIDRGGVQWHVNRNALPDTTILLDLAQPVRFTAAHVLQAARSTPRSAESSPTSHTAPSPDRAADPTTQCHRRVSSTHSPAVVTPARPPMERNE